MNKRLVYAVLAVFGAWVVLDFVIHGLILESAYATTSSLWRPAGEMKTVLLYFTVLASAAVFVLIYDRFFADKGRERAVKYGLLFGAGTGVMAGYGLYAVMPIPYVMAFVWFAGSIVEGAAAGWVMNLVLESRTGRRAPAAAAKGRKTARKPAGKGSTKRAKKGAKKRA